MARRPCASERLALSLGFTVRPGKKHGKVFDQAGRLIAVYPCGRGSRDKGTQWDNYRAALIRHSRGKKC